MIRKATAVWNGTIKEGKGTISTESGVLKDAQYSFKTRFENGIGTNPEELIGAAHSGCFTMQLSAYLTEEDFSPEKLETTCEITFEDGEVTKSHLKLKATVPNIKKDEFDNLVKKAKENCPLSKLLKTKITVEATLNE
ncbi:OsmC family protein [Gillisia limnaea]|uniref:Peroxiredoxin, OsmC subfamily n=1 Tax=Gillisia limnaea (strain DSM 15749 / LMG 21470 / R-8282) TaxID=865937 RepID=H2BQT2_GILLR|nr:OsmC family protein [Gillisia limnaea]EHQ04251.1 peroxiredoxin, OsmC subfamily [Gillisia limnaea DSM 15749]